MTPTLMATTILCVVDMWNVGFMMITDGFEVLFLRQGLKAMQCLINTAINRRPRSGPNGGDGVTNSES